MDYWESIIYEVKHRRHKNTQFRFTNLGEKKSVMVHARDRRFHYMNKEKEQEIYYLGGEHEDIYFTRREAECMFCFLKGMTIASAAEVMGLSPRTVEFYVKNMKMKLRCASKSELVDCVAQTDFMRYVNFDIGVDKNCELATA